MEAKLFKELKCQTDALYMAIYGSNSEYGWISKREWDVIVCLFNIYLHNSQNLKYYYRFRFNNCLFCHTKITTNNFSSFGISSICDDCLFKVKYTWADLREHTAAALVSKYMFIKCILGRDLAAVIVRPIAFIPALVCIEYEN